MARKYPHPQKLTKSDFKKAIWLDFEGVKNSPPAFAGIVIDGEFDFFIIDSHLEKLEPVVKDIKFMERGNFIQWILDKSILEKRPIVAFSVFEYDRISEEDTNNKLILNQVYRNARKLAKRHFGEDSEKGLKDYLRNPSFGYSYPDEFSEFSVTGTITSLWSQCKKNDSFKGRKKRSSIRKKLRKLRRYNKHDCLGMQHIIGITVN